MDSSSTGHGPVMSEGSSCSSGKRSRMSTVWDVFERLPPDDEGKTKAKCGRCGKILSADPSSGTSGMHRHLSICANMEANSHNYPIVDHHRYRTVVAQSIIRHNYPYNIVEHEGTRDVHKFLNPTVKIISRNTTKADVLACYNLEKEKLKRELELIPGRICLTSDMWSSFTTDSYMCVTAHCVDLEWVLQKKILIFHHMPTPHTGVDLGDHLVRFLSEWDIDKKIFTITLDNARYQDGMVGKLKDHLIHKNSLVAHGDFLHVRCSAHILNLIVQNGLKAITGSIHKIRESVKYVKGSQSRKMKFAECVKHVNLKVYKKLRQDVPTRWNSTYLMLECALIYREAFYDLSLTDREYFSARYYPNQEEWCRVEKITAILKPFYDMTVLFSGGSYPTSNLYFSNVRKIEQLIQKNLTNEDVVIRELATLMSNKFRKYWDCYSVVLSFAVIMDPRHKLHHVDLVFKYLNPTTASEKVKNVKERMFSLFDEYMQIMPQTSLLTSELMCDDNAGIDDMDMEFEQFVSSYGRRSSRSELDMYLDKAEIPKNEKLDVLDYWKSNKNKWPALSLMARDILSIPITTVASESAFSIGGRVLDKYRTCTLPKNVEARICTRDWLFGCTGYKDCEDDEDEGMSINIQSWIDRININANDDEV